MPRHECRHLIVGGGIIGCAVAYHLARRGETGVVLLEKASLTEGATWHAAGLVGQLRAQRNTTRMLMRSVALYDRLEAETGMAFDWKKVGSLRLAATPDRMLEAQRLATMARSFGLEMAMISPAEARDLFPLIDARRIEGAAFISSDGHVDPAGLCLALAAGARSRGAEIRQGVRAKDLRASGGRISEVQTSEGTWTAKTVTLAAGMWSRDLGRPLGLRIPACAVEHQYVVTEPLPDPQTVRDLPQLRDPERLIYVKPDAGGRLVLGGYEEGTRGFGEEAIPGDFVRQLLPDAMDRFAPLAERAAEILPALGEVGIRQVINGPIPYSADGDFVMGWAPGFSNLMLATGFLYGVAAAGGAGEMIAEWIVDGRPSLDLWPLDARRFGAHHGTRAFLYPRAVEHYAHHYKLRYPGAEPATVRGLRRSPLHDALAGRGAVWGTKNGWERPLWFAPEGVPRQDQLGFLDAGWEAFAAEEHRAVRERVALIDQTSFAKFEIAGPGALSLLQRLAACDMDRPPGSVLYAQLLNDRGGIEADVTITRLTADRFYLVTGAGFGVRDSGWLARHLPQNGSVQITEVTSAWAVLNLCGPRARAVLAEIAEEDVANAGFPFGTAQDIAIGAAPVRALRVGYTGELGWELHVPTEFAAYVHDLIREAGVPHGLADVGYRAIDGLRLEKGYLYWSADIGPDHTPYEAGLGFRVHLGAKGDFIGRAALERQKAEGVTRRLATFTSEARLPLFGGETILADGRVASLVTSTAFGHSVGRHILLGWLEGEDRGREGFEVEAFGERHPIRRVDGPLWDKGNERLKG